MNKKMASQTAFSRTAAFALRRTLLEAALKRLVLRRPNPNALFIGCRQF